MKSLSDYIKQSINESAMTDVRCPEVGSIIYACKHKHGEEKAIKLKVKKVEVSDMMDGDKKDATKRVIFFEDNLHGIISWTTVVFEGMSYEYKHFYAVMNTKDKEYEYTVAIDKKNLDSAINQKRSNDAFRIEMQIKDLTDEYNKNLEKLTKEKEKLEQSISTEIEESLKD